MTINVTIVEGRLGQDAEYKPDLGNGLLKFSCCTNTAKKQGDDWVDEPNWIDVEMWGNRTKHASTRAKKGAFVVVKGSTRQQKWTDKQGNPRSKLYIRADECTFGPTAAGSSSGSQGSSNTTPSAQADSDIPF